MYLLYEIMIKMVVISSIKKESYAFVWFGNFVSNNFICLIGSNLTFWQFFLNILIIMN